MTTIVTNQETFLVAFEQITTYSGNVSFGAWLMSMVQNRSTDSWRKNRNVKKSGSSILSF